MTTANRNESNRGNGEREEARLRDVAPARDPTRPSAERSPAGSPVCRRSATSLRPPTTRPAPDDRQQRPRRAARGGGLVTAGGPRSVPGHVGGPLAGHDSAAALVYAATAGGIQPSSSARSGQRRLWNAATGVTGLRAGYLLPRRRRSRGQIGRAHV